MDTSTNPDPTTPKKHRCDVCPYSTDVRYHLCRHVRRVHQGMLDTPHVLKLLHCEDCDYTSADKSHLIRHIRTVHDLVKAFRCEQCGYAGSRREHLMRHIRNVHMAARKEHLANHVKTHHPDPEACKRDASPEAPHGMCHLCGYVTASTSALANHIKAVHEKVKDFQCELCDFSSAWNLSFIRHVSTVHGDNVRSKKSKGKKKAGISDLAVSAGVQEGGGFRCGQCDFTSLWKDSLTRHVRAFHGGSGENSNVESASSGAKSFACELCEFTSTWKDSYLRHVRTFHGVEGVGSAGRVESEYSMNVSLNWRDGLPKNVEGTSGFKSEAERTTYSTPTFDAAELLRSSLEEEAGEFTCEKCAQSCASMSTLASHMKAAHNDNAKDFRCDECGFETAWKLSFTRHLSTFHNKGSEKYKCEDCDFISQWSQSYSRHVTTVHGKEACFKCNVCDHVASSAEMLNQHARQHVVDNGRHYNFALPPFEELIASQQHQSHQPDDNVNKMLLCEKCDFTTYRKNSLLFHRKTAHETHLALLCEDCGFSTSWKDSLTRHMKSFHGKVLTFKCKECDFTASVESALKRHVKHTHSKLQTFRCEKCDYTASQRQLIDWHVKAEHEPKAFRCGQCAFTTSKKHLVNQHRKEQHTEVVVHKCEHCDFVSENSLELKDHMKKHCKVKCRKCDFATMTKKSLAIHIRKMHSKRNLRTLRSSAPLKDNLVNGSELDKYEKEDTLDDANIQDIKCEPENFFASSDDECEDDGEMVSQNELSELSSSGKNALEESKDLYHCYLCGQDGSNTFNRKQIELHLLHEHYLTNQDLEQFRGCGS